MASEASCDELLLRLLDVKTVIKGLGRDLPWPAGRTGLAILVVLERVGPARVGELSEMFDVDQSVISRRVADLEDGGWTERVPNPHDRRSWFIRATPEGERLARESCGKLRRLLADALTTWSDDEITELSGLLARLRASVETPAHGPGRTARVRAPAAAPPRHVNEGLAETVEGH
ncbi:MarR family transcriptional regulator [Microbispora corallina]|uniref:MarR family transcriptional regulator n=1 Tax=Microbispora corallina TaxID=83302 RepID=A0ABQ4FVM3_9ACTN|nr:MarR family winged helix-turn-helix transcriptional regulator [Microbispora corallina]GIH38778.1 MarR family transcriptional regulator [Microbispora corallina]